MDTVQRHESIQGRKSAGALLGELAANTAALLRDEIDLVRQVVRADGQVVVRGAVIVAIGVLVGQTALVVFCAAVAIAFAPHLGLGPSVMLVGTGLAISAGMMVYSGVRHLHPVGASRPRPAHPQEGDERWPMAS